MDSWINIIKDNKLDISTTKYHKSWIILDKLFIDDKFMFINNYLLDKILFNKEILIFPKPENIFNAFYNTNFSELNTVILGQDPYPNFEINTFNEIKPYATGEAFSVNYNMKIPSSLNNIYKNLYKFNHIYKIPNHGCLTLWSYQGVLLLNTTLTVEYNKKKIHSNIWKHFTDEIIRFISNNKKNIVFLIWGNNAYEKIYLIDKHKHIISVSSHPSGLSNKIPFRTFPAFDDCDHFNIVNQTLINHGKKPICWQV